MQFNFVKVATYTPKIKVCDVEHNVNEIIKGIELAKKERVELLTFPELSITGSTCGELFYLDTLLYSAKRAVVQIAKASKGNKALIFLGCPIKQDEAVYDTAVAISDGNILAIVPKTIFIKGDKIKGENIFTKYNTPPKYVRFENLGECEEGIDILMHDNIVFCDQKNQSFKVGVEFGDELNLMISHSTLLAQKGARILVNLSSSPEIMGEWQDRLQAVKVQTKKANLGYCLANAGEGESTTDLVFSGHSVICERGEVLAQSKIFENGLTVAQIDLQYLDYKRNKTENFQNQDFSDCFFVNFSSNGCQQELQRIYDKTPFIPKNGEEMDIILTQSYALKKRLEHTNASKLVLGMSGGLDSTLAGIVCKITLELMGRPSSDLLAITMPCFGTTSRTFDNSVKLAKALGAKLKKVDISKSVTRHLKDISHDQTTLDSAYENAQARERTQVLMDIANMQNGLVVGTGDLSELALGWATYNGDHMSNYAVNSSISKTLVKHLVTFYRDNSKGKLKAVLTDILGTPVSPELLPPDKGEIKQKTEDIVGPYILHDFFLYNILERGCSPKKLYNISKLTFKGDFEDKTILKWLTNFYKRFFSQQFKRSCMPDGVKATKISLSPRQGFSMPTDAVSKLWLKELEEIG